MARTVVMRHSGNGLGSLKAALKVARRFKTRHFLNQAGKFQIKQIKLRTMAGVDSEEKRFEPLTPNTVFTAKQRPRKGGKKFSMKIRGAANILMLRGGKSMINRMRHAIFRNQLVIQFNDPKANMLATIHNKGFVRGRFTTARPMRIPISIEPLAKTRRSRKTPISQRAQTPKGVMTTLIRETVIPRRHFFDFGKRKGRRDLDKIQDLLGRMVQAIMQGRGQMSEKLS